MPFIFEGSYLKKIYKYFIWWPEIVMSDNVGHFPSSNNAGRSNVMRLNLRPLSIIEKTWHTWLSFEIFRTNKFWSFISFSIKIIWRTTKIMYGEHSLIPIHRQGHIFLIELFFFLRKARLLVAQYPLRWNKFRISLTPY